MKREHNRPENIPLNYRNRILAGVVAVLIVMLLLFSFADWHTDFEPRLTYEWEDVLIDEVALTVQRDALPPPPRPRIGPPVIQDEILSDELDPIDFNFDTGEIEAAGLNDGDTGEANIVGNPDQPARVRRIVEAVTPDAARDMEKRVIVTVTLLVRADGRVDEVFISQIETVDDTGNRETITHIGYGIIEETIRAASGWLFIPARHGDEPVASYSTHRFTF